MSNQEQQRLINEFYDYLEQGDSPQFNFTLIGGNRKIFDNVVEFLQNVGKLKYIEVTVIPF